MVALDSVPGVVVSIIVNDEALQEYDDEHLQPESDHTVTKYIESTTDAEFAIFVEILPTFTFKGDTLAVEVSVDGKWMDGELVFRTSMKRHGCHVLIDGPTAQGKSYPFCFAPLETVPQEGYRLKRDVARVVNGLGNITVQLHHVNKVRRMELSARDKVRSLNGSERISEKALKGKTLSHSTKLGEPRAANEESFWDINYLENVDHPAAVFNFNYRSSADLKSMYIIPRTPSPALLEDDDLSNLSHAALLDIAKTLRKEQNETANKIKRERVEEEHGARKKARRAKTRLQAQGLGPEVLEERADGSFGLSTSQTPPPTRSSQAEVVELD